MGIYKGPIRIWMGKDVRCGIVTDEFKMNFRTPRNGVTTTDNLRLIHDGEDISIVKWVRYSQ